MEELLFYTNSSRKLKRSEYFPALLDEASIILIPKLDKNKTENNCRQVAPMNIDAKISKVIATQIQQNKRLIRDDQVELIPEMQG